MITESPDALQPTTTPFKNIALAFSGGGFRAASFCLGTLSYLKEIPFDGTSLLQHVSYISSASGGTIANAMYALNEAQGQPFGVFYKKLFDNLDGTCLLDAVFDNLNNDKAWEQYPHKQRNLINAFAITYNQLLFDGTTVSSIQEQAPDGHLDEVCFNTTEFFKGLLFRQAIKLKKDPKPDKTFLYGNYLYHLLKGAESELKLADLLAASSCFPAGFEPIIFPDDFATAELKSKLLGHLCIAPQELSWSELLRLYPREAVMNILKTLPKPIQLNDLADKIRQLKIIETFRAGFMDGGITDNQGIESMMRANERRQKKETSFASFDLMLVNDVGSHYMDPFIPQQPTTNKGLMALSVRTISITAISLGIIGIALLIIGFRNPGWQNVTAAIVGTLLLILGIAIPGSLLYLHQFIGGKVRDKRGLNLDYTFSPRIVNLLLGYFSKTPLGVILNMLKDRFSSVLTLNNDVFLKRIRHLLYARFMGEGRRSFRMKTNHVYDLSYSNDLNRLQNDIEIAPPSAAMQIVSQCAFEMGTTLWFDQQSQRSYDQAALIACGQFTTCYNLLLYILRMKKVMPDGYCYFDTLTEAWKEKVNQLEQVFNEHYIAFSKDPFWLYNQLGKQYQLTNFTAKSAADFPFPEKEFKDLRPIEQTSI